MLLFIFFAKYIFSIAAMATINSKTYFNLLHKQKFYEWIKKLEKWNWTKFFPYNSPLVINSQI